MNDPESKQINVRANKLFRHIFFLGLPTERLGRLSLAQFVAPRRTRVDLLALDSIRFKFSVSDLNSV